MKSKTLKNTIAEDDRKLLVKELRRVWEYVCWDCLREAPNREMEASEIREVVPDYLGGYGSHESEKKAGDIFWNLTEELQSEILKEAFPRGESI